MVLEHLPERVVIQNGTDVMAVSANYQSLALLFDSSCNALDDVMIDDSGSAHEN